MKPIAILLGCIMFFIPHTLSDHPPPKWCYYSEHPSLADFHATKTQPKTLVIIEGHRVVIFVPYGAVYPCLVLSEYGKEQ